MDTISILNLAGILGLLGFVWKIANGNKKKVSYESFDRYKKEAAEEFRNKEVCNVLYQRVKDDIQEIKKKVDCIPAIKLGIDLLLKKNGIKTDEL